MKQSLDSSRSHGRLGELERFDWRDVAVERLRYLCGVAVVIGVIGGLLSLLRVPNEAGLREGTDRPFFLLPIWLGVSLGVLWVTRQTRWTPQRRLDVGLAFLVVSALAVAVFRHWLPYESSDVMRGVSPVSLLILFYAVVVPTAPRRMLIAASLAALMDPLGLALSLLAGNPTPPWNLWLWLLVADPISVVLATITSRSLYSLEATLNEAREMGSYRLVERLGQGGMGEVWRAEHQTLSRPAAIKLIRPEILGGDPLATQRTLQRFEREARATSALSSPHTIAVYDSGLTPDGAFYYVMELLEGCDLQALVERHGPLPPARAVHLLLQICHSLREAHSAGLVHRDVKPANIFVCRQGLDWDVIKVLDFGLVKFEHDEETAEDTQLTREGSILGSPAFMAPEAASGDEATRAVDIYALGCVAFWMLTGRLLFDRPSTLLMLMAHVQAPPEPASRWSDAPIPQALDALILACLEKSPAARPQDLEVVEARLRALDLASDWSSAQAREWWAQHEGTTTRDTTSLALQETVEQGSGLDEVTAEGSLALQGTVEQVSAEGSLALQGTVDQDPSRSLE